MHSHRDTLRYQENKENEHLSFRNRSRVRLENRFNDELDSGAKEGNVNECNADCNPGFFRKVKLLRSGHIFRFGAEKVSKTYKSVKSTFGNLSQRLRLGSRRSRRLTEYNMSPMKTPSTAQRTKQILGRTPVKLYSPFGIETPRYSTDRKFTDYNPETPEHGYSSPSHCKSPGKRWQLLFKKPRILFQ